MRINQRSLTGILAAALLLPLGSVCSGVDENSAPAATTVPVMPKRINFDAATYKGETGKIILPIGQTAVVELRKFENGKLGDVLSSTSWSGAAVVVPAGTYRLRYATLRMDKNDWSLLCRPADADKAPLIEVKAGSEIKLLETCQFIAGIKSGKTGTITSAFEATSSEVELTEVSGEYVVSLSARGIGRTCAVPTGEYLLTTTSADVSAKDGGKWRIATSVNSLEQLQRSKPIRIKADGDVKLRASEPLTASVRVEQRGDQWALSLNMVGTDGGSASIRQLAVEAEAPGFQVLDKSGKVVASGKFQYG